MFDVVSVMPPFLYCRTVYFSCLCSNAKCHNAAALQGNGVRHQSFWVFYFALARLRVPVFFAFLSCFSCTCWFSLPFFSLASHPRLALFLGRYTSLFSRVLPPLCPLSLAFLSFLSRSSAPPPSPTFWRFVDIPGFLVRFPFPQ